MLNMGQNLIRMPGLPLEAREDMFKTAYELGYELTYAGGEWYINVIPCSVQPQYGIALSIGPTLSLGNDLNTVTSEMLSELSLEEERLLEQVLRLGNSLNFSKMKYLCKLHEQNVEAICLLYGKTVLLADASMETISAAPDRLAEVLSTKVIPCMKEVFGATYVRHARLHRKRVVALSSLSRICYLRTKHEFYEAVARHNSNKGLQGLEMRNGIFFLRLQAALSRIDDVVLSQQFWRFANSWSFFGNSGFVHTDVSKMSLATVLNMSSQARSTEKPFSKTVLYSQIIQSQLNVQFIIQCLDAETRGINNLFSYLRDLSNFLDERGDFSPIKHHETIATIKLLIADFNTLYSIEHTEGKMAIAMNFMDKLAGLVRGLGESKKRDDEIFKNLISLESGIFYKNVIEGMAEPETLHFLIPIANAALHSIIELRNQMTKMYGDSEMNDIDEIIRIFRNLNHGGFLNSNKMFSVYEGLGNGAPGELMIIPYFLMWALLANPAEFIKFHQ